MPYIEQSQRRLVSLLVDMLANNIELLPELREKRDGVLNFIISRLLYKLYKINYTEINAALGVLDAVSKEYYRRVATPYENSKMIQNGDVYCDDPKSENA